MSHVPIKYSLLFDNVGLLHCLILFVTESDLASACMQKKWKLKSYIFQLLLDSPNQSVDFSCIILLHSL